MNKTLKVVLIILAVLTVLCACSTVALVATGVVSMGNFVKSIEAGSTEDPTKVASIASSIADFEIPAGFSNPYGMNVANFNAIGYFSESTGTHFLVTQLPGNLNLDIPDLLRIVTESSAKGDFTFNGGELTNVEKRPVTISGQQATLSIEEGRSSQGELLRMGSVSFKGKQGNQVILMITGPAENWDESMVESLIASFK